MYGSSLNVMFFGFLLVSGGLKSGGILQRVNSMHSGPVRCALPPRKQVATVELQLRMKCSQLLVMVHGSVLAKMEQLLK